jgi:hypothetical protein
MSEHAAALEARDLGMERAERGASPEWRETMFELVEQVARQHPTFTTDGVFEALWNIPEDERPTTPEGRALGPVMIRAAKAGICSKADMPARLSRRRSRHAAPLNVWRSHLIEQPRL